MTLTLGELQRNGAGGFVHAYCNRPTCGASRPLAIAPYVIRWGADASSDLLRKNLVCERCKHKGASLYHPSWKTRGWESFPVKADRPG